MEHYIELIDGTRIEAFPKAVQPETIKEDKLALDTTGEYLQISRRKRKSKRTTEREQTPKGTGLYPYLPLIVMFPEAITHF